MKNAYKYILIILVVILFSFAFTSSHRIQSIDDLNYIVALGIDVGDTERLKVTFQFTKPSASSGEGSSNESSSIIMEVSETLNGDFELIDSFTMMNVKGYEGPICYKLNGQEKW